jgi:hypothetical protein
MTGEPGGPLETQFCAIAMLQASTRPASDR